MGPSEPPRASPLARSSRADVTALGADKLANNACASARSDAQPNVGFWQRLVEAESWMRGGDAPSVSLQQFKWQFLEESTPGVQREQILQQLELGQAEVHALLHRHSYTAV